jgi:hypothetical protein
MSIYATLWKLKFPRGGDDCIGCDWVEVTAQGVLPHIGSPNPEMVYEAGDSYLFIRQIFVLPEWEGRTAALGARESH